jgi:hypothetical protein
MIILASIVAALFSLYITFSLFFKDWDDFWECVRYYFTPDIVSAFRGEWMEDWWGSLKLGVYLLVAGASGTGTFFGLHRWLG